MGCSRGDEDGPDGALPLGCKKVTCTRTPGRGKLYIDGKLVGEAAIPVTTPIAFNPGGLTCGANPGVPVTPEYPSPFKFTGKISGVTVDVSGDLTKDTEAELRRVMARQ